MDEEGFVAPENDQTAGLYNKFTVKKVMDPTGKHQGCFYFSIDCQHDQFAKAALTTYARECAQEYPQLAEDLWDLIETL
jgi:hypothetical protein